MIYQSGAVGLKGISRAVATAVIAFLLAILFFASTAFAGLLDAYNVEIVDNGEAITITTNETEPIEILAQANIARSDSDHIDISSFQPGEGGTIVIVRKKTINVEKDGIISTYDVYANTVGAALEEAGLTVGEDDHLNYNLSDTVADGMVISIESAFYVIFSADNKTTEYAVTEGTVADLVALAGVTLGKDDSTKPSLETELTSNLEVQVLRVEYKEVTETEEITYSTVTQKDASLESGKTKMVTEGENGEEQTVYKVKYVNGEEESREKISITVTKEAVDKVVKIGTKKTTFSSSSGTNNKNVSSNGVTSKNGYSVGQVISGKYTHYCACATCNGNSNGVTASGRKISNGMSNPYYVACNWLPLGSVIDVDGTYYTVVDRGGSGLSQQGRIDIFTPEGHSACYRYGTGACTITIIRLGW